jgi:hypothetical protein
MAAACGHPQPLVRHPPGTNRRDPPLLPVPCWRERSGTPVMRPQNLELFSCITVGLICIDL